jgi:hypothetical protein
LSHEMMKPWERRLSLMAERNMSNVAMRDIVIPPGSKSTSRTNGLRRNLGDLGSGHCCLASVARIGKVRSRSR